MKTYLKIPMILVLAVFLMSGSAMALSWVVSPFSPDDGTIVFSDTNIVGVQEINDPETGIQASGIYGAGFVTSANGVIFDANLQTWDSYSATGDPSNNQGGKGWWDVFIVNINQEGFYWDLVNGGDGTILDPVIDSSYTGGYGIYDNSVLPGSTWAFGGEDYGNGTLETLPWGGEMLLTYDGDPDQPYYVSVVLDTATDPDHDIGYASWGSFHVSPVPEPATMLLLGSGLLGLAGVGRKKLFKQQGKRS